jgi:purine-nucleoside phosphorylase
MDFQFPQALAAIRARWDCSPQVGIILGTGLGGLASAMQVEAEISYQEIPFFPSSTAMAHRGVLLCGTLAGRKVLMMAGRCHLYEGYSVTDIQLPVRVMHALGIELLILSNAAGGLNPRFRVGDVMVLEDHLNLMGFATCPPGLTVDAAGAAGHQQQDGEKERWREGEKEKQRKVDKFLLSQSLFLSVSPSPYDPGLISRALAAARHGNFPCQRGVYVGVKGPNYETRAEYRAFRRLGGDAVGMSTIPEVLAARELGMKVLGLSTITNVARPDAPQIVTSDEVVHVAGIAEPKLRQIVLGVLS